MPVKPINVHGTELLASDTRDQYRQKLARITLDSMVQFVGLLDAKGTVLEINKVALDAVGITLADVEGKPFWTTFWWQVSDEINATLRESILRAAKGEFVRWDTAIYGRAGGKETIIIDASLCPVMDEQGEVVFIAAEGRDITEKKAYEREIARQREELAELDKLKTKFFANISHEFRTPLTLMMGPLEDTLAQPNGLPAPAREQLELAHRNSLRLLKLVNTLLDFSRIEAGRIQASYHPVDLAHTTAELASVFRSAVERAGMKLVIDCEPVSEPVFVDPEMWEKIVLNLLSNAFKFTFDGEIDVSLREVGRTVELTVRDTGIGIPVEEIPRLFDRFHRVKGAQGRSYEGSGIGLALVQELVKLHGGSVRVESELGTGSSFIVSIPLGTSHLPQERIEAERAQASTGLRSDAYVEEVLRWLPGEQDKTVSPAVERLPEPVGTAPFSASPAVVERILLADDNADMRDYVRRLLAQHGYQVDTVGDGLSALAAARSHTPNLVLTDVMMPGLDGFELLRELRTDPNLSAVPVILLSARAGEEARIEGMHAGADDYLTKPFSARELLARVETHLKIARIRRDVATAIAHSEERFRAFVTTSSDVVYQMNADWSEMRHLVGRDFIPDTNDPNTSWIERYIHPDDREMVVATIREAIRTKSLFQLEHRVIRVDGTLGWTFSRAVPIPNEDGEITEWFGAATDVTERKRAEMALAKLTMHSEQQRRLYETILSNTPDLVYVFDLQHRFTYANEALLRMWGRTFEDSVGKTCLELGYEPWHAAMHDREIEQVIATKRPIRGDVPFTGTSGRRIYDYIFVPVFGVNGEVEAIAGTTRDVTDRKLAEERVRDSEERLLFMAESMPQKIFTAQPDGRMDYLNRQWMEFTGLAFDELQQDLWHHVLHPDETPENIRLWRHSLQTGEPFQATHRFRRADGAYRWHLSRAHAMTGNDGKITMWIGSSTEIHEQKNTEDSLRRANQDLEQFAYAATHDLQEPLRGVKIYSDLLAQRYGGKLDGQALVFLNHMLTGASRMEMLVRDLLSYTQVTKVDIPFETADAAAALQIALANLSSSIAETGAEVNYDPLPSVKIHDTHLQQLFQNLIGNAIKYHQPGVPPVVNVTVRRENDCWHFTVSDNGIGIDPEYNERIFGLFKRLHTSDRYSGTGVGLALCQRIVERNHGRIWVDSEPGKGARFHFTLLA